MDQGQKQFSGSMSCIYTIGDDGFVYDQMGIPIDRDVIEQVLVALQYALLQHDDEEIETHRERVLLEMYPSWYEQVTGKPAPLEYVIAKRQRSERERAAQRHKSQLGYVYVLRSEYGYKIGRTKDVDKRKQSLGLKVPFTTEMIIVIQTDRMLDLEKDLHARFADKRINGEWFRLGEADLDVIRSITVDQE